MLAEIQRALYDQAAERREANMVEIDTLDALKTFFAEKQRFPGWAEVQWSRPEGAALDKVVEQLKALKLTFRNVPADAAPADGTCLFTGEPGGRAHSGRARLLRLCRARGSRHISAMKKPHGLPSPDQVLEFIRTADGPAGKREIARAFGLKGQEKIALKKLLADMAEEGLIDGRKSAYHRMGGLPKVTVLRVVDTEEGYPVAVPDAWQPDDGTAPPRVRIVESKKGGALRKGDRVLARTEEAGKGWRAHPIKKLPATAEAMLGVIELDGAGKPWLAPVDKRVRNSFPVSDIGEAEKGNARARRAGRQVAARRSAGDRGARRSACPALVQPDRDPQVRHSGRLRRGSAGRSAARGEAAAERGQARGPAAPAHRRDRSDRRARPRRRDLGRA